MCANTGIVKALMVLNFCLTRRLGTLAHKKRKFCYSLLIVLLMFLTVVEMGGGSKCF